ncbi:early nodulin-93-like [Syzygium oleosum]|uniref:early nodulin-93-like n=1 Tax=Syzygium oleosum TaxID=219896 RepID=UPI0024BA64FE|nr:early nodulin-93-like [Syzygium oleosum]
MDPCVRVKFAALGTDNVVRNPTPIIRRLLQCCSFLSSIPRSYPLIWIEKLQSESIALLQLASARMLPWARANLNHAAQALIISTVAGAAYFIVADKTVLDTARRNSFKQISNIEA